MSVVYKYVLLPNLSKCNRLGTAIVAIILSTLERFESRQVIRKTWTSKKRSKAIKGGYVAVYFIIAAPKHDYDNHKLIAEQEQYNDLVVTDIEESYENLVLKVYTAMLFFQRYCSKANFLMKIDDDVIIHLDRMIQRWDATANDEKSIFGLVWEEHQPIRDPKNKWFIPYEKWPMRFYPNYCDGPFYMLGRGAVNKVIEYTKKFDPFPFEDVFYTGIVATYAGIPRVNWSDGVIATDEVCVILTFLP
ncbi:N-acetyllactosaminide 3-alpha-galactosyltransferase [Necator americanus]|uniref:Hexosyltransferase n=1 Tax=Necator americanus TaxID=51031 RepID=W2TU83_NECAM|nr:N-acetyllactosaminide 3-alpha-galactosyltransferase [Necator americanus]ETN85343.1 N-acetyllactosaminide 3-alpha-galactosyltransferase [Necator americanus]